VTRGVPLELLCLDLAGTTVADDGLVEAAFAVALDEVGVPRDGAERQTMEERVAATMGTSKLEVFGDLLGDGARAERANRAFEAAYEGLVRRGDLHPIAGVQGTLLAARQLGLKLVFTTGFSPATRDLVLATLGWVDAADLALSPADAGRGRPFPDMILTAVLRLQVSDVAAVAVAGDTWADMAAGRRAGASLVVGVLSGADRRQRLVEGGATHVLPSVADLPPLLATEAHDGPGLR